METKSYFVKLSSTGRGGGVREFKDTLTAKEMLKDLPWVEVVEPDFAYSKGTLCYLVTRWINLPTLLQYIKEETPKKMADDLEGKVAILRERLGSNFSDICEKIHFMMKSEIRLLCLI